MAKAGRVDIVPYGSSFLVSKVEYVPIITYQKEFDTLEEAAKEAKRLKDTNKKAEAKQ